MKRLFVLVLAGLAIGSACAPVKGAGPSATPAPCPIPSSEAMVDAVNADRAARGLGAVVLYDDMGQIAQAWADHMAAVGTTLPWHSPDSHRAYERVKSPTHTVTAFASENVLGPSVGCLTAAQMQARWMASPGHRDNILRPHWETLGFGVAADAQGRLWSVQEFGF